MFLPGWSVWCVLLTLPVSACGVEISGYSGDEVICSQVLSDTALDHQYKHFLCCGTEYAMFC